MARNHRSKTILRPGQGAVVSLVLAMAVFLPVSAPAHNDNRPAALENVALLQKIGAPLPLELAFRDQTGKAVRLGEYFGKRPVILNFVYYRCQDICPLLLDGLARTLRALSFEVGNQFNVLTVSFEPRDTPAAAAARQAEVAARYGRAGVEHGWHFLTGDAAAIQRLTEAAGFRFNYDEQQDRFGHATGIMLATPEGKIARYFYGIEFSPRDLRLGLIEASAHRIGSPVDQLLLFCYHYDPVTGKYGLLIINLIRWAGIATVLALGLYIFARLRAESNPAARAAKSA